MSKRKKKIGTSAIEELVEIALSNPDELRSTAFDHVAAYSKKHRDQFSRDDANKLYRAAMANDGKQKYFYHSGE